ncbi:hypothetical protein A1356_19235 [Methylomonas koyamae]|uniref:Uncharacterized protein n=1 Tax=Methylomonas koyamae TaxID=702114 RepID=A0AA91D9J6_9GAMM|nr:hypothetical protein A1356_19235 [Methylomonas koyamae]
MIYQIPTLSMYSVFTILDMLPSNSQNRCYSSDINRYRRSVFPSKPWLIFDSVIFGFFSYFRNGNSKAIFFDIAFKLNPGKHGNIKWNVLIIMMIVVTHSTNVIDISYAVI